MSNVFTPIIAKQLALPEKNVDNTLALLDEGCTIPFISRYRKERTGGMNEVQIAQIPTLGRKRCPPEEGTFTLSPSLDFPGTGKDCGLRFVGQRMLLQGDL